MIAMQLQRQLLFPVLSDEEVAARLDYKNPSCAFHESRYVGNPAAVDEILDLAYSAFQTRQRDSRGELRSPRCCPKRIALLGRPSVGKTTFAKIFACDVLRLPFCSTTPEQVTSAASLFGFLKAAYAERSVEIVPEKQSYYILPAGVLFIDEVHLLSAKIQDALLSMTEINDGKLTTDEGVVDCRNLCIIIATTDKGKLRGAFKTRFRHILLRPHSTEEVARIVKINHEDWSDADCLAVARLKPVPREAKDFADSVVLCLRRRKLTVAEAIKVVADREGVSDGGININAFKTLKMLVVASDGLSRSSLCAALCIEPEEFENDVMPCLVANELHPAYVAISNRHFITDEGRQYVESR